jgi:hypothetical protein
MLGGSTESMTEPQAKDLPAELGRAQTPVRRPLRGSSYQKPPREGSAAPGAAPNGKQPPDRKRLLLSPAITSEAARRLRERSLAIALGLVALSGTGLFAAVDQLSRRAAPVPCVAPDEPRHDGPGMTTVDKFRDALDRAGPASRIAAGISSAPAARIAVAASVPLPAATAHAVVANGRAEASVIPAWPRRLAAAPGAPAGLAEPTTTGNISALPPSPGGMVQAAAAGRDAPTAPGAQCPSPKLNAVLADVAERFGAVTVVAGHQLTTANHVPGSSREKLHQDCMALDFRPDRSRVDEIKTYLRSRPEIGGVDSYRDGVVHMDLGGTAVASRRAPTIAARKPGADVQTVPPQRVVSSAAPLRDDR